jgi:hypothetical protein
LLQLLRIRETDADVAAVIVGGHVEQIGPGEMVVVMAVIGDH